MRIVHSFIKTNLSHFDAQSFEVIKDNQTNDTNRIRLIASHLLDHQITRNAQVTNGKSHEYPF
jgi:hypothetical protein